MALIFNHFLRFMINEHLRCWGYQFFLWFFFIKIFWITLYAWNWFSCFLITIWNSSKWFRLVFLIILIIFSFFDWIFIWNRSYIQLGLEFFLFYLLALLNNYNLLFIPNNLFQIINMFTCSSLILIIIQFLRAIHPILLPQLLHIHLRFRIYPI